MAQKGRKPKWKSIDVQQLKKLAERQWSAVQIASFFNVSDDTIHRRFADIIKAARHNGAAKIIDLQWKRALEGSDSVLLHMSKHYLGQHDKKDPNGENSAIINQTFNTVALQSELNQLPIAKVLEQYLIQKGDQNAISKQSSAGVDVREQAQDGKEV